MGTNRRGSTPAEHHRQIRAMLSPEGRRHLRHCWIHTPAHGNEDLGAPGVIIEWAESRSMWYARVAYPNHGRVNDAWFPYTQLTPVLQ